MGRLGGEDFSPFQVSVPVFAVFFMVLDVAAGFG